MANTVSLRIGILGSGTIAHYHARACRETPGIELVAAANWRPESLARLAGTWSIPRTYSDAAAMAADPEVDAVIICVPNSLHATETVRMLRAGKHVLVEKPMALNAREAEGMARVAEETGRALMVAHMWRFDREVQWLRRVIRDGLLGDIVEVKSYMTYVPPTPKGWFLDPSQSGGGVIIDMGVHGIDTIRYLLGEALPLSVYARTGTHYSPIAVEDDALIVVNWDGGAYSTIETSSRAFVDEREMEGAIQVYGTRGYARLFPTEINVELAGNAGGFQPTFPARSQRCDWSMYQKQLDHFAGCVRQGIVPVPGAREGLLDMQIVDAAYASAARGEVVRFA